MLTTKDAMPILAFISFHKEGHHCCIILTPSRPDKLNIVLATLQTQSQIILDAKQDFDIKKPIWIGIICFCRRNSRAKPKPAEWSMSGKTLVYTIAFQLIPVDKKTYDLKPFFRTEPLPSLDQGRR